MASRGKLRLWLLGLTFPIVLVAATIMGILGSPTSPAGSADNLTDLGLFLLIGPLLFLYGVFAIVAVILWKRSERPCSPHHEIIASVHPSEADLQLENE